MPLIFLKSQSFIHKLKKGARVRLSILNPILLWNRPICWIFPQSGSLEFSIQAIDELVCSRCMDILVISNSSNRTTSFRFSEVKIGTWQYWEDSENEPQSIHSREVYKDYGHIIIEWRAGGGGRDAHAWWVLCSYLGNACEDKYRHFIKIEEEKRCLECMEHISWKFERRVVNRSSQQLPRANSSQVHPFLAWSVRTREDQDAEGGGVWHDKEIYCFSSYPGKIA
jgi:hypothetical protein